MYVGIKMMWVVPSIQIAMKVKTICDNIWIADRARGAAQISACVAGSMGSTPLTCYALKRTEGYRNVNEKPKQRDGRHMQK